MVIAAFTSTLMMVGLSSFPVEQNYIGVRHYFCEMFFPLLFRLQLPWSRLSLQRDVPLKRNDMIMLIIALFVFIGYSTLTNPATEKALYISTAKQMQLYFKAW